VLAVLQSDVHGDIAERQLLLDGRKQDRRAAAERLRDLEKHSQRGLALPALKVSHEAAIYSSDQRQSLLREASCYPKFAYSLAESQCWNWIKRSCT